MPSNRGELADGILLLQMNLQMHLSYVLAHCRHDGGAAFRSRNRKAHKNGVETRGADTCPCAAYIYIHTHIAALAGRRPDSRRARREEGSTRSSCLVRSCAARPGWRTRREEDEGRRRGSPLASRRTTRTGSSSRRWRGECCRGTSAGGRRP